MEKNDRIYSYDIIKLIMALVIATLHFNYELVPQGYLCVEGFFLVGGFFLASTLNVENSSFSQLVNKRIFKLYPMYLGVLMLSLLFFPSEFTLDSFIKYTFYIQSIGFLDTAVRSMIPLWYLSVYVWCSILFLWLFKNKERKYVYFLSALICYISFLCLYSYNPGHAFNYSLEKYVFLPVGMMRGLANMSLGILIVPLIDKIKELNKINLPSFFVSILQLCIIVTLIKIISFSGITAQYDFVFVFLFSALIILFKFNVGVISDIFNKMAIKIKIITKLSYPIYIYHCFVIVFIKERFIDLWNFIFKYPIFYLLIVIIVAFLVYEIEKLIEHLLVNINYKC